MAATKIPTDIWLHIASFLAENDLCNLYGVNSAFLNLGMDARYREVMIENLGSQEMAKMNRLRDPFVAKRTRRLVLQFQSQNPPLNPTQSGSAPSKDSNFLQRLKGMRLLGGISKGGKPTSEASDQEQIIEAIVRGISSLSSVDDFSAGWWRFGPPNYLSPILNAAWTTFGPKLHTLALGGNLDTYNTLLEGRPKLSVLQNLKLEFTDGIGWESHVEDGQFLMESIAPLVTEPSLTLRSLTIVSWAAFDLSEFFLQLPPIPHLHTLHLRLAFNRAFSTDPSGLTRLLHSHSKTLQHVILRFNPSSSMMNPWAEQPLALWLTEMATNNEILVKLKTLQLYPTVMQEGFDAMLTIIRRSADTLTFLVVRDRYLVYEEVESLVRIFADRHQHDALQTLRLNVRVLSPGLIDVLAKYLPDLESLVLFVGEGMSSTDPAAPPVDFWAEMEKRVYPKWKLQRLGIWQGGFELEGTRMQKLAISIPSVRYFWDKDDKSIA